MPPRGPGKTQHIVQKSNVANPKGRTERGLLRAFPPFKTSDMDKYALML